MIGRGRFESEGAEGEPGAGGRREICCNMNRIIGPVALRIYSAPDRREVGRELVK